MRPSCYTRASLGRWRAEQAERARCAKLDSNHRAAIGEPRQPYPLGQVGSALSKHEGTNCPQLGGALGGTARRRDAHHTYWYTWVGTWGRTAERNDVQDV